MRSELESLFFVQLGERVELLPTGELFLGVLELLKDKVLHSHLIHTLSLPFVLWNGDLGKVDSQEGLDLVPVVDVLLTLGDGFE